jgi:hypothetical protein
MSEGRFAGIETVTPGSDGFRWVGLYRSGGIAALLITVLLLGEIAVYAMWARPETALKHFELIQQNWLAGLLTLDLLGAISYVLFIPTILALYVALRPLSEAMTAVATALFFVGIADFFATNTAFPVLALSNQYAAATTDAARASTLAAGEAMFALFNENAFLVSYVLVSASWSMIGAVMLRSSLFGRATACAGILAGATGIIAVFLEHISEALVPIAIGFYFAAIVFLLGWVVFVGRRLYRLGTIAAAAG